MRRLFTLMSDQVQGTAQQLRTWWDTLSPDPTTWVPFTWVLVAVAAVILLALLIRPRRRAARRPELLISHGELRVAAWAAPKVVSSLQAPHDVAYELAMTVSNLSASPVQLLELAVRTNAASAPTAAEVAAVLPPHGAVDVTADLQEAGGDEGVLDLFVYVPDMPPKTFRVRAKLLWEPWNARYRVLPLDQRVDVARGFSERAQRRQQMAAVRRGRRDVTAKRVPPRWRGAAATDEGRFEPRPEFARPRSERTAEARAASTGPARRGQSVTDEGVRRSPYQVTEDTTWPASRPERQQHHARAFDPGAAERDAPASSRQPPAASQRGPAGEAAEPQAWRLGDADRLRPAAAPTAGEPAAGGGDRADAGAASEERVREAPAPRAMPRPDPRSEARGPGGEGAKRSAQGEVAGPAGERSLAREADAARADVTGAGAERPTAGEPASVRAGLGRAARAARGSETTATGRGAPAGPRSGSGRHGPSDESKRPRRWAVRSDAAAGPDEAGPGELVGPDEVERDAPAREAAGREGAPRAGRRAAGEPRRRDARAAGDDRSAVGAGDELEREEPAREEPARPKLEFPDEF